MKITKHKEGANWRVHIDGKPTPLLIVKGEPPKYRQHQEWDVVADGDLDCYFLTAYSLGACIGRLETLATIFTANR